MAAYEDSTQTSVAGLLSSTDPTAVLGRATLLQQLAGTHQAEAAQLLASARQVTAV